MQNESNKIDFSFLSITLSILKGALFSKKQQVFEKFYKIGTNCQKEKKYRSVLPTMLEFFRALTSVDTQPMNICVPNRTLVLSATEFSNILNWKSEEEHFLVSIQKLLNEQMVVDESPPTAEIPENDIAIASPTATNSEWENLEDMKEDIEFVMNLLKAIDSAGVVGLENSTGCSFDDLNLVPAEGIVTQFAMRISYVIVNETLDDQLTANYWLNTSSFEEEEQIATSDQTECDLTELIKICLPPETNITSDCKRLLNLSASPQASRDRQQSGLCFRARRVEVEPTTGRPEKKIFGKCE